MLNFFQKQVREMYNLDIGLDGRTLSRLGVVKLLCWF